MPLTVISRLIINHLGVGRGGGGGVGLGGCNPPDFFTITDFRILLLIVARV